MEQPQAAVISAVVLSLLYCPLLWLATYPGEDVCWVFGVFLLPGLALAWWLARLLNFVLENRRLKVGPLQHAQKVS
jgi:hypothetical protein